MGQENRAFPRILRYFALFRLAPGARKWHRGGILLTGRRLRAGGLFGLDASARSR